MAPKKRDQRQAAVQADEAKTANSYYEQIQTDHELFLQAFEKPTQIYRYLRTRSLYSPTFLQRTLGYMAGRCTRKVNTRSLFSVDDILAKVEMKHRKQQIASYKSEYLNLIFSGFFDKENVDLLETVDVEVSIMKISHKKRKDVSSPVLECNVGKVTVPCNPVTLAHDKSSSFPPPSSSSSLSCLSISSEHFFPFGSQCFVKSYVLIVKVTSTKKKSSTKTTPNSNNRMTANSDLENEGPPKKKLRSSKDRDSCGAKSAEDGSSWQPDVAGAASAVVSKTYSAELTLYDRHHRCLLTDGDYELALEEQILKSSQKHATWETVSDGKNFIPFDIFTNCPTVKFSLRWNKTSSSSSVVVDDNSSSCDVVAVPHHHHHHNPQVNSVVDESVVNNCLKIRNNVDVCIVDKEQRVGGANRESTTTMNSSKKKRIFYQFLYNNNMRQQTEASEDFRCPWCYLGCLSVSSLLSHLRSSHARFNFTHVDYPKGGRIDVSINESYDGSYVGNPQDLHSHIGYAFSRNGPVRRMSVTHVLVNRFAKASCGWSEFCEADSECGQKMRQTVHGHNRLYYHTLTCMPVHPSEIDIDSEEENYPNWLKQKTQNMIDDFTDVNEGEKEIMKKWNLHVMQHNFISDNEIAKACSSFIDEHGPSIVRENLSRNLLLHFINLSDFGLLRPSVLYRTTTKFFRLRKKLNDFVHPPPASSSATERRDFGGTTLNDLKS